MGFGIRPVGDAIPWRSPARVLSYAAVTAPWRNRKRTSSWARGSPFESGRGDHSPVGKQQSHLALDQESPV